MDKKLSGRLALVYVVLLMGLFSVSVCTAQPTVPSLISPRDGATLPQPSELWTFDWTDSLDLESGIRQYELYVIHKDAEIPVIDDYVKDSHYSKTLGGYITDENLKGWTWKVRAQNNKELWSDWSETQTFAVEARDTTPPAVIESTPIGENVPVTTEITVTFSEPMNKESVESASYIYPEVPSELYWEDNTLIFTPSSNLNYDTRYVAGIEGGDWGAMDLAGNIMVESYEWEFETISPELIPATAIISATPKEIKEGESVSFSAEASSDQDGYIVSYDWDFGDGDTDTGINVEHMYLHSGHYTATLTVIDNDGLSARDRVMITVNPLVTSNIPPTASLEIYSNPAGDGERVTFEGYGEDEDGEVVECRWTFPDGRTFSDSGSSSSVTLEPEDVHAGWYSFAVRDEDGAWSEEVRLELETPTTIPWMWLLAAIVLVIAAALIIRKVRKGREKGSIYADSNPQNALIFLDKVFSGLSPATVPEVPMGAHLVKFRKFGYFDCKREAMVKANQTTHVHCDLTEIPGIKLKLSAEPTKISADGKSKSVITIWIEDKNGIPIPVPEDVTVELVTNNGTIESPVKIPAGRASVTATLTSSTVKGTATVKTKAEFLKGSTTVEFLHST
jgi:PKD repeat protein